MNKYNYIVVSSGHKNWAIGHLAKILVDNLPYSKLFIYPQRRLHLLAHIKFILVAKRIYKPNIKNVVFMHHGLAVKNWDKKILNYSGNLIVRYTHDSVDLMNYVSQLNQVTAITVENSQSKIYLQNIGVNEELIHILPHPIDLKRFQNCSETKCRDVIFVSNFAERKNPQLIFDTIKFNPDLEFSILGKSWQNWPHFQKLLQLKNLKFLEFNYETYPKLLGQHKVFCSLSSLEGGPVPLIEALACNLNVVVTDTGHARDLIKYPRSYNIISLNSDFSVVGNSLRMALKEKRKLTDDLGQYSYEEYILKIQNLLFN